MATYKIKFWFEHGGICLWGANDITKRIYCYAIKNEDLPLSTETIHELYALEEEYGSYLDWECPQNPSPWTEEHKLGFILKAEQTYSKVVKELGANFEVINDIRRCVI